MTDKIDLDAIEAVVRNAASIGADIDPATAVALVAEVRRLRARLADEERQHGQTIDDRDHFHDMADKLAYAVAPEEVIGEHSSMNCPWENALDLITPAAEVDKLRARVAELEEACTYARSALAALCYDLEDPGSNALGALYELSRATTGVDAPRDDAAEALARHDADVIRKAAQTLEETDRDDDAVNLLYLLADRTQNGEESRVVADDSDDPEPGTGRCGARHHDHPETVCTEPAGHYQPTVDPHAGPLVLDGRECGRAAWDKPTAPAARSAAV